MWELSTINNNGECLGHLYRLITHPHIATMMRVDEKESDKQKHISYNLARVKGDDKAKG